MESSGIELVYLLVTKAPSGVVIFATGAKKNTTQWEELLSLSAGGGLSKRDDGWSGICETQHR